MVAKVLAVAVVLVAAAGCATTAARQSSLADGWMDQARAEGVVLESPLRVSPQIRSLLREKVGYAGTEKSRLLKLVRFMGESDGLAFQYQTQSSLTAEKAFAARRGDCMSYANLLVALARTLDVPVRFVRITQLPVTWEAGGRFFESSHMAVALGRNASWDQAVVVDFGNVHTSPWRFSLYDDVSDDEAFVLFQNNVAVQRMLAGDMTTAERILRFFHQHSPRTPEIPNNLSLVLLHNGRDREALELLEASVEQFPHFRPLFANAVHAARRIGDEELAQTLEEHGRELLEDEPAWNFNEGMRSYHARAYSTAALRFEKALSADPDNVRLLAWSARAHLAAGNLRRGLEQVERIRSGPPSETRSQLLEDLRRAFPQLEAPPPVPPPPVADRHHERPLSGDR
ncbi:MAG TPA: tetratricopeptide repeat protein [Candidatus Polarisedimenticolaceae bacterium]|nr:tetratricopeptide repeat protein [Candidatus Polarisedimenticolaceae bacterium]